MPSLTEAIARTAPGLLVGATDWCVQPPGLGVARVGGTKNPDVGRVVELAPDLVVANFEENRPADLDALRAAGVPVWVTVIRTLPEALTSLERMLAACGQDPPGWLADARTTWADVLGPPPPPEVRAVVPIWRRPWMVLGRDTFAGDLLARLGVANLYAHADERYPKVTVAEMLGRRPDLVVLPDEPYAFSATDGPEMFPGVPVALVSGRHLEWYGPSLTEARRVLGARLPRSGPASSPRP
ncbi:helical backbone metal receptor [Actinoallomurus soli]|uniref:helical backbone metal receptor n=1 Tax=Actinoallomurus soli TaxID=2952535 RepID=UPI002092ACF0|nr:helical backbone metal receptor [Actinoallomurus soli]MCO5967012.1 helical backbone metal receptor [Actinoallomurus soli]